MQLIHYKKLFKGVIFFKFCERKITLSVKKFVTERPSIPAMADIVDSQFPIWGLLPKKETGVTQFLTKYPEYDGRGIVIAIFDSGVDPGAPGLKQTSEGKVKIIERYDCSGAGDVCTSTVVEAKNGKITGLSGRILTIPSTWKNPTGKYHIGIKNLFDLYPRSLLDRIEKERKEKLWDPHQKNCLAEANRKLQEVESKSTSNLGLFEKLFKQNLEAKSEVLTNLEKKYKDVGPAYDCVVFHDGTMWRACVDTTEKGKLEDATLLGEYSLTHEYATFSEQDQLNYSINVHSDGNLLELVSVYSSHGTHVASIASAYFPDEPEKNGVAPGAQIISLCIADNRIGTMETGTALVRAMIKVMQKSKELPLHVINMSYGEHSHFSSSGRIGSLMAEVCANYNVTWVNSAGNRGPALCTINTPPDITTNSIIGVGAYVSPDMMVAEYSMREKLPGMPYTWSSRGPTIDGDVGVTVCAPGGAITSVPPYTLRHCQQLNGTSMSSPHVCGAVALLLSGMVQRKLKFSPFSVKRALENSAMFLNDWDSFAQGFGLLQVDKAFEHLCQFSEAAERDIRFSIQCGLNNAKGIHVRKKITEKFKEFIVNVEPIFPKDTDNSEKTDFNMKFTLVCNEAWVQASSHLDLMNMSRPLSVRIDIAALSEGVHSTKIRAYDSFCPEKGVVFYIPITVVNPTVITNPLCPILTYQDMHFKPNTIKRHFILVPSSATWATFTMKNRDFEKTGKFILHFMQLRPQQSCKSLEFYKTVNMNSNAEVVHAFQCKGDLVLEVVVAKYWANLGDITVDYTLEFHGVRPDCSSITMIGADGIHSLELFSGLRMEEILPVINLKNVVIVLRPNDSKISPLCSERDVIPPSRQIYEIVLTYNFHLSRATEVSPNNSLLSNLLYESEFEAQLWMLFDSNKQLLGSGDAYPSNYSVKLEKGDYVLKMHIRHEKKDLLEKFTELPILLSQKLSSPVNLDVYVSQSQALISGKKMGGAVMPPGGHILPVYIAPINNEKGNKELTPGHFLTGTISFTKDENGKKVDVYPFKYILPEPCKKSSSSDEHKETDKEKSKYNEYKDSLRDQQVNWLAKIDTETEALSLYEELKTSYPGHLPVHTSMLQSLEPIEVKNLGVLPLISFKPEKKEIDEMVEKAQKIIAVADEIISNVDEAQVLAYIGMKNDARPDADKIKTQMNEQKAALIDAYCRKGCALCRLYYFETTTASRERDFGDSPDKGTQNENLQEINKIWKEIMKFSDPTDLNVIYFTMWHSAICGHYGRLAKYLQKLQEKKPSKEIDLKLVEVYKKLGWEHCEKFLASWIPVKYPTSYRSF